MALVVITEWECENSELFGKRQRLNGSRLIIFQLKRFVEMRVKVRLEYASVMLMICNWVY